MNKPILERNIMINEEKIKRNTPKIYYENLMRFKKNYLQIYTPEILSDNSIYPCLECRGKGSIYDPNDPPDVIEGNKLRNRITCPNCKGNTLEDSIKFKTKFKQVKEQEKQKIKDYKQFIKDIKALNKKLTKQEKETLQKYHSLY